MSDETFKERLERLSSKIDTSNLSQHEKPKKPTLPKSAQQFDADLIPEVQKDSYDFEDELTRLIGSIGIIDAYKRWVPGKTVEDPRGRTESIMCQCPTPQHADKKPSAWVNTDKNTWFCGGCQAGGDGLDLAAEYYGISNYKSGKSFHDLRRAIASEFGMQFRQDISGRWEIIKPESEEESPKEVILEEVAPPETITPETPPPEDDGLAEVISIDNSLPVNTEVYPGLDWHTVAKEGTFLWEFMEACRYDDVPEEYHFWHGMLAIGMAMGRDVGLADNSVVYGNLFICILGRSGSGKSRSKRYLDELLGAALPFESGNPATTGVRNIRTPASAEALICKFIHEVDDPAGVAIGKKGTVSTIKHGNVRGLVDYNELSSLLGRASRVGNVLLPTLMQFYDGDSCVSTSTRTYGDEEAKNAFSSVTTTSQPAALGRMLDQSDVDSGFLNRWLFVTGTEKKRVAIGGTSISIEPCIEPLKQIAAWASPTRVIQWSELAHETFTNFFDSVIEPTKQHDDDNVLVRADLTMKKLCLLFSANSMETEISKDSVDRAILCWDYLIGCYSLLSSKVGNSIGNEMSDEILRLIAQYQKKHKGYGMSMRDINTATHRKKWDKQAMAKVVETLLKLELIKIIPKVGTVGRPGGSRYGVVA